MRIESATNVKNHFGAIMDAALREPVIIQRSGRNSVVMIPYEDYENMADKIWGERAIRAAREGEFLGTEESEKFLKSILHGKKRK